MVSSISKWVDAGVKKAKELGNKSRFHYESSPKSCPSCLITIPYEKRSSKFCSHSCAASFNNKLKVSLKNECLLCGKFSSKENFCSSSCRKKNELLKWLNGELNATNEKGAIINHIRSHLMKETSCQECGWSDAHPVTGRCPLEIDHIDGDSTNNFKNNLRVICARCHSMTSTFRGLNKGKGRKNRRKGS